MPETSTEPLGPMFISLCPSAGPCGNIIHLSLPVSYPGASFASPTINYNKGHLNTSTVVCDSLIDNQDGY
jgi:hypothetical protein